MNLISHLRLLQRTMRSADQQLEYCKFVEESEKLDAFMRRGQQREETLEIVVSENSSTGKNVRSNDRDDEASNAMYRMKSVRLGSFRVNKATHAPPPPPMMVSVGGR